MSLATPGLVWMKKGITKATESKGAIAVDSTEMP